MITRMLDLAAPSPVREGVQVAIDGGWQRDRREAYCHTCGATCGPGAACAFCKGKRQAWDEIVRLTAYREPMAGWIQVMKFHKQWHWASWLGEQMAEAAAAQALGDGQDVVVCPTPMHWARRWRRGYNQAQVLAEAVAKRRGLRCIELLMRTRYTTPQTMIPSSRREPNVRGSVAAIEADLSGQAVWLIDDVKTSGATLTQCAKALRVAGAGPIHAIVAAVAHPLGHDFTRT